MAAPLVEAQAQRECHGLGLGHTELQMPRGWRGCVLGLCVYEESSGMNGVGRQNPGLGQSTEMPAGLAKDGKEEGYPGEKERDRETERGSGVGS